MKQSLNAISHMVTGGTHDAFTFEWHQLRYQHTAAIRSGLMDRHKPATANKMLAAMKRTLKECQRLGLMNAEDYAATDLKPVKNQSLLKGRALSQQELSDLLTSCTSDLSASGLRDSAMLMILRVGLRRAEVVKLDLADFSLTNSALTVRHGKGGKDRITYLPF